MNNKIRYLKSAKEALESYIENPDYDYKTCEKIYGYINNLEALTKEEKEQLDNFINSNLYDTTYLANIYTNPMNRKSLRKQLLRMIPINLSKSNENIYQANGDFSLYTNTKKEPIKIKTYPKKSA